MVQLLNFLSLFENPKNLRLELTHVKLAVLMQSKL